MRRALINFVPSEILLRRTKQSESRCYVVTLEKHWGELNRIFTMPLTSHLGYVDQANLLKALTTVKNGRMSGNSMLLLRSVFLELWLRHAVERNIVRLDFTGMSAATPRVGTIAQSASH